MRSAVFLSLISTVCVACSVTATLGSGSNAWYLEWYMTPAAEWASAAMYLPPDGRRQELSPVWHGSSARGKADGSVNPNAGLHAGSVVCLVVEDTSGCTATYNVTTTATCPSGSGCQLASYPCSMVPSVASATTSSACCPSEVPQPLTVQFGRVRFPSGWLCNTDTSGGVVCACPC
eukprot:TRINITY_DN2115_c0_g1_i1.p3 TRINITY_DN2115_c0_g1~~TRINITY_DN2115_c0_g1_i1.p3  ORF type:complete len:176 (-),score=37.59 TRINITY_DN2115_c0_g1_i1:387-914(-)